MAKQNIKKQIKFIEKASKKFNVFFDYSKVVFINQNTKIKIICPTHGETQQIPKSHMRTLHGCGACADVINGKEKILKAIISFEANAKKIHGDKYLYDKVDYKKINEKVIIICKKHGPFTQTPGNHLYGHGCPICNFEKLQDENTYTTEEFIYLAQQKFGTLYDYSKAIYSNGITNITIICKTHGEFSKIPNDHIRNNNSGGCQKCEKIISIKNSINTVFNKAANNFEKKAKKVHGDKYDYTYVKYIKSDIKVNIFCKIHDKIFLQKPNEHINSGHGCPDCSHSISKPEIEWLNYLNVPEIFRQKNIKIILSNGKNKLFKTDAFDPNTNTVYEFNGDYWHGNPHIFKPEDINRNNKKTFGELYDNTIKRQNTIIGAGYDIISIWENDWKEIKKGLI